jgi:hypothetical protein
VRFKVLDQPGVFGEVASLLGQQSLSITEAFQRNDYLETPETGDVPAGVQLASIHLQLKATQWGRLKLALEQLHKLSSVQSTLALPILE